MLSIISCYKSLSPIINLCTILTFYRIQRKCVIPIAVLSLFLLQSGCTSGPNPYTDPVKEAPKKTLEKKRAGQQNAEPAVQDSVFIESPESNILQTDEQDTTANAVLISDTLDIDLEGWEKEADSLAWIDAWGDESVFEYEFEVEDEEDDYEEVDFENAFDDDDPDYSDNYYIDDDDNLRREHILKTEVVEVKIPENPASKDTLLDIIDERMRLHPKESQQSIVVEKWSSPVNFRGYKFNRKKMMLYGVEKNDSIAIYYYSGKYYFEYNTRLYHLRETIKNANFETVKDSLIIDYLRNYED